MSLLDLQLDDDRLELCGDFAGILLFLLDLVFACGFLVLDIVHDLRVGNGCELLREEEVACISVGNFDDLVLFALSFDIL